ncbi:MAG: zinc-dependent peptidase [Gemmatimonadetes bacterium]|nr:zinc-dependent peptidase [Gemmatimonadota bacterium]
MTSTGTILAVIVALPIAVLAIVLLRRRSRAARRARLMKLPFPDEWRAILEQNLPPYDRLPPELQERLHGRIHVFLAEKNFEGCGGLALTDEIRVTIAAQACLLLLNRKPSFYPKLDSVLVYPSAYVAGAKGVFGRQRNEESVRLGESWHTGAVVLSWNDVKRGASDPRDGHNVTYHEFAHQLDQEDGSADGTPVLDHVSRYSTWAEILEAEYQDLTRRTRRGRESVLDQYGATNRAEFFAVATETFFEKPAQLKAKHPELYEELSEYYKLNPEEWQ